MAAKNKLSFVLATLRDATVDPSLASLIAQQGGVVARENELRDFSVYVGASARDGQELDGWVFGDNARFASVLDNSRSQWLKEHLRVGSEFAALRLAELRRELTGVELDGTNIDGESLCAAMLHLATLAENADGLVYVQ
jgi:hypothetical protein